MTLQLGLLELLLLESGSGILSAKELGRGSRVLLKLGASSHHISTYQVIVLGHHVGGLLGNVGHVELVCTHHILIVVHLLCALVLDVDILLQLVACPTTIHVQVVHFSQLHLLLLLVNAMEVAISSLGMRRVVSGNAEALAIRSC